MKHITREELIKLISNLQQRIAEKLEMYDEYDYELWGRADSVISALHEAKPAMIIEIERDPKYGGPSLEVLRFTDLGDGKHQLFAMPCSPATSHDQWYGHKFKEVQDGKWRCECGKEINEAQSAKAQVPEFLSSKDGDYWPRVGEKYLICINDCLQEDVYTFDQGDDGMGGGEYFWSREDLDECPPFNTETDKWFPISAMITASPTPDHAAERNSAEVLIEAIYRELERTAAPADESPVAAIESAIALIRQYREARQQEKTER